MHASHFHGSGLWQAMRTGTTGLRARQRALAPAKKKKSRPKPAHLDQKEDPDEPAYRYHSHPCTVLVLLGWTSA